MDLCRLYLYGSADTADERLYFIDKRWDRGGLSFFKDPVAEIDDGDDRIANGDTIEADGCDRRGQTVGPGPINVEKANVQSLNGVIFQGLSFQAIEGKAGSPIVKAHCFGPLVAGGSEEDKGQQKQSKMGGGGHRDNYFLIKVGGNEA